MFSFWKQRHYAHVTVFQRATMCRSLIRTFYSKNNRLPLMFSLQKNAEHHFTSWLTWHGANIYFPISDFHSNFFPFKICTINTICAVDLLLLICSLMEMLFVWWSGQKQKQHSFLGHFMRYQPPQVSLCSNHSCSTTSTMNKAIISTTWSANHKNYVMEQHEN